MELSDTSFYIKNYDADEKEKEMVQKFYIKKTSCKLKTYLQILSINILWSSKRSPHF